MSGPGHLENLTEEQTETLKQLRINVQEILRPEHDDSFLLRWLRARKFNLPQAEAMLRENLQWRKLNNVDNILETYQTPEVLRKYYPGGLIGHTKEHCPLWIIPFGDTDIKGLFYSIKKSDFIKHIIWQLEISKKYMKERSEATATNVEMHSFIFDLDNFNIKQIAWKPALDMIINLVTMYEDNYPEMLKKAYVINAPKLYPFIYNLLKPFLSEETARKIHVYGKDNWKDALLADIDPDQLPVHWGGTKLGSDGDPRCSDVVGKGGTVPVSFYTAPSRRLSTDNNLKQIILEKKSCVPLSVQVKEAGSMLRWEFQTENYDIGFGVFYIPTRCDEDSNPAGGILQEILPMQRVNCHLVPEDGMLVCKQEGTYVLKFDNSFSWYRSKKLLYHYEVLAPSSRAEA